MTVRSIHALRIARAQCTRFRAIADAAPTDWRFAAKVQQVDEKRLDLEGLVIEEQAAHYLSEKPDR